MSAVNDGGPAFPVPLRSGEIWDGMGQCDGMTLRDYFAAKAMQGFAADPELGATPAETIAEIAYAWADAMLKARGS